jgi:hypothetical protein
MSDMLHDRIIESLIVILVTAICVVGLAMLGGCASPPVADIPVPVTVDCHYPDPGPKPDLSAMAALTKDSTPQQALTVMGEALAALAQDDARLRALMAHGN